MKRLNIVVEGQTEQSFVNEVLAPYLRNKGVGLITPILIRTGKTGRGGLVNYHHLYNTIKGLLSNPHDRNIVVSSFVDFSVFRIICRVMTRRCDQVMICRESKTYSRH